MLRVVAELCRVEGEFFYIALQLLLARLVHLAMTLHGRETHSALTKERATTGRFAVSVGSQSPLQGDHTEVETSQKKACAFCSSSPFNLQSYAWHCDGLNSPRLSVQGYQRPDGAVSEPSYRCGQLGERRHQYLRCNEPGSGIIQVNGLMSRGCDVLLGSGVGASVFIRVYVSI